MEPTRNTRGWWPAEALVRRSAPSPVAAAPAGGGGLAQLLAQRGGGTPTAARDNGNNVRPAHVGLDQLTTLCLAEQDNAATATDEEESTGPPHHQPQPVNRVLRLGSVKKGDTADSTTMASLLHTLQQGGGDGPAPQLATTTNTAAVGLGGAARPAAVPTLAVEGDECDGDVPLVSRRHQPCYHYSPPVTKDTPTVVDSSIAWQSSPPPSGRGPGVECDASVLVQPPGASSPHAAFVDVVVPAAPARVPVGLGVVESSSSALQEQQQHPAWAAQACSLLFAGVFLTAESRDVLAALVPPVHPLLRADHLTLAYRPSVSQLLQLPLGAEAPLHVVGSASDARSQAVFVDTPGWLQPTTSASTHITISLALGARAVEAGGLIRDALQRTADGAAAQPGTAAGGGAYQHFDEPLPLVGRVGVRMAVPAAVAAQLRQAGRLTHQAGQAHVLRQGPSGVEEEVVLLSIADVAATGCITLDEPSLQLFRSRHAGVLGAAQVGVGAAAVGLGRW
jgi:hypothetical protein